MSVNKKGAAVTGLLILTLIGAKAVAGRLEEQYTPGDVVVTIGLTRPESEVGPGKVKFELTNQETEMRYAKTADVVIADGNATAQAKFPPIPAGRYLVVATWTSTDGKTTKEIARKTVTLSAGERTISL